jgi:hypothetical protein
MKKIESFLSCQEKIEIKKIFEFWNENFLFFIFFKKIDHTSNGKWKN